MLPTHTTLVSCLSVRETSTSTRPTGYCQENATCRLPLRPGQSRCAALCCFCGCFVMCRNMESLTSTLTSPDVHTILNRYEDTREDRVATLTSDKAVGTLRDSFRGLYIRMSLVGGLYVRMSLVRGLYVRMSLVGKRWDPGGSRGCPRPKTHGFCTLILSLSQPLYVSRMHLAIRCANSRSGRRPHE